MVGIEAGWRNRYILEEFGIGCSGHARKQTIVRPKARLILPVDNLTSPVNNK